jgi:hypothetical protein
VRFTSPLGPVFTTGDFGFGREAQMTVDLEQIEIVAIGASLYFDCKPYRYFIVVIHFVAGFT